MSKEDLEVLSEKAAKQAIEEALKSLEKKYNPIVEDKLFKFFHNVEKNYPTINTRKCAERYKKIFEGYKKPKEKRRPNPLIE